MLTKFNAKLNIIVVLLFFFLLNIQGPVFGALAGDGGHKKYKIKHIQLIGNIRIPAIKIRELISLRENRVLSLADLEKEIKISKAYLENENLFLFVDIQYEVLSDNDVDVTISLGENVILLEMLALPEASLTRFNSISEKAPDFGFYAGSALQALYFRFPYIFSSPLSFSLTAGHQLRRINFNINKPYDYESAFGRLSFDLSPLYWLKLKAFSDAKYNARGSAYFVNSPDISGGGAALVDFSNLKSVYHIGFDLSAQIRQGFYSFGYTAFSGNFNLYIKPFKWEELIVRGRYYKVFQQNVPDYILGDISGEYNIRGNVTRYYYGRQTVMINCENWIRDIFVIPAKVTSIHFNVLAFADFGAGYNSSLIFKKEYWNFAVGGAIEMNMSNPVNLSMEMGYGYELWQNTGGNFYVKLGRKFYKGNFYE